MGATVATAIILHEERDIVAIYRSAAATVPDRARRPSELGIHEGVALRRLRDRAVLREAAPGDYFLDEPSWAALRRLRRRVLTVVLIIVAALILLGIVKVAR